MLADLLKIVLVVAEAVYGWKLYRLLSPTKKKRKGKKVKR